MSDTNQSVTVDLHGLTTPAFPKGGRGLAIGWTGEGKVPDLLEALGLEPAREVIVVADGKVLARGEAIAPGAKLSVFAPIDGG